MEINSRYLTFLWPHLWHEHEGHLIWHGNHTGVNRQRPAVMWEGKKQYVSRLVLAEKLGRPLAEGEMACHIPTCTFRSCVHPDHLYAGTHSQNMVDQPESVRHEKAVKAGLGYGRKLRERNI